MPGIVYFLLLCCITLSGAPALAGITTVIAAIAVTSAAHTSHQLRAQQQANQRAEQALLESEARYHLLAEYTSDLIALLDTEGRIIYASPSYGRVLGHTPNTLKGMWYAALIHPAEYLLALEHWHEAHRQGSTQAVYRIAHADGSWRWIEAHLIPITHGGAPAMVLSGHDFTARRTLEAQLEQAYTLVTLGQLASGMAHDVNNLLTSIRGSIELASATLPEKHPAQNDLAIAQVAGARATALVREVSVFARRQVAQPQPLHLGAFIPEFRPLLERLAGPQIRLITEIAPDAWPIKVDPTQMMQVLMNLALNARDAMPDGGTLTITASNMLHPPGANTAGAVPPKPVVRLSVTDTGAGMSEEVQRHLFEPFYSTKAPDQGTGLGLTIVYGIVRQRGGEMTVSSSPGAGATFTMLLPGTVEASERDPRL